MSFLSTVKTPTLYTKSGSFGLSEGSAECIDSHRYNRVVHIGKSIGEVILEGIVSLCYDCRYRAFYALEFPPLVIKALGIFDPIFDLGGHV